MHVDILGFEAHEEDEVDVDSVDSDLEDRLGFIEVNDEGAELGLAGTKDR